MIAYILPALNGLRRAYRQATLPKWSHSQSPTAAGKGAWPTLPPLDDVATSQLRVTFAASEWDDGSESGRAAVLTLETYEANGLGLGAGDGMGISPSTKALANLELQQAYWSSRLLPASEADAERRWSSLLSPREEATRAKPVEAAEERADVSRVGEEATAYWHAELAAVEEDRADLSATEVLAASLVRSRPAPVFRLFDSLTDRWTRYLFRSASRRPAPSRRTSSRPT